jgi:hypothetical protein
MVICASWSTLERFVFSDSFFDIHFGRQRTHRFGPVWSLPDAYDTRVGGDQTTKSFDDYNVIELEARVIREKGHEAPRVFVVLYLPYVYVI